jgi:flavin reductase (DIM6/NTAB) family NADH-FMN oxidoreductase RutF
MNTIRENLVTLELTSPVWEQVYSVSPLVLIGSREINGEYDLAPKHMAMPLGWNQYFGFICTPKHGTYSNIEREKFFTVSYPRPNQAAMIGLAAAPRCEDNHKWSLRAIPHFPASQVDGVLVKGAYLFLECALDRIIDGFGDNSLIVGNILAASASPEFLRQTKCDEKTRLKKTPLMAYLYPDRFAQIEESISFPFPEGFHK